MKSDKWKFNFRIIIKLINSSDLFYLLEIIFLLNWDNLSVRNQSRDGCWINASIKIVEFVRKALPILTQLTGSFKIILIKNKKEFDNIKYQGDYRLKNNHMLRFVIY